MSRSSTSRRFATVLACAAGLALASFVVADNAFALNTTMISTTQSDTTINAGHKISDSATVTGNNGTGGTVTFNLYGPDDATCQTPIFSSTVNLKSDATADSGNTAASATNQAGTYQWTASYSGSNKNLGSSDNCGDEPVIVTPAGLDHLVLSPANATIAYGQSQAYTAEGFDQFGNDRGSVGGVTYTIAPTGTTVGPGSCTGNSCTGPAGTYTVTGTKNDAQGSTGLTIGQASSSTMVTVTPSASSVSQLVTVTATVSPVAPATTTPTGTVSFFVDGSASAAATVPLVGGVATWTTTFGGGSHSIVAVYNGDANYTTSTSMAATESVGCTTTVTGVHSSLAVHSGTTCLSGATIKGSISVPSGAVLDIENSTVQGSISSSSAAGLRICGSQTGSITVTSAAGFVLIGDPMDNCAGNTIKGSVLLANNHHGLVATGNTYTGTFTATGNSGAGPLPGEIAPITTGNTKV